MIYSSLTNEELLRVVEDKRKKSPLIESLCSRLEGLGDELAETKSTRTNCPVCEAALTMTVAAGSVEIQAK